MRIDEASKNKIDLKPFVPKNKLNKDFFNDDEIMHSVIRMKLLDIADDFIKSIEMNWAKPKDIVVTGSIANYNWSKYSDVDIHIIYNFKSIYKKTDFIKDYFDSKRNEWNRQHEDLTIKGFPVEISIEDSASPAQSSGIYSIEKNRWVKEPKNMDDAEMNKEYIKKFCMKQIDKLDDLFGKIDKEKDNVKLNKLSDKIESIYNKLHNMRKEGLASKSKEMSTGNIIWKVIKHAGYIDKIWEYINNVYDRVNTINEGKTIILTEEQYRQTKPKPLNTYLEFINQSLGLYNEKKITNSNADMHFLYKTLAEMGLKGRNKKWFFEDRIRAFFSSTPNCQLLRKYYIDYKFGETIPDKQDVRPATVKRTEKYPDIDYTPKASKMSNFIDLDDVSELNENIR